MPRSASEDPHRAARLRRRGHGLQKLPNKLDAYPRAVAFIDEILGRVIRVSD